MALAIAVGEYSNHPELIRLIGYTAAVFICIVFVCWSKFATRVWFWIMILLFATGEFAIMLRFADQFNKVSAALAIPLAIAVGVVNIVLVFIVAATFEHGWKNSRRATSNNVSR